MPVGKKLLLLFVWIQPKFHKLPSCHKTSVNDGNDVTALPVMRTAIAAAFADSLDPKPLRTVYADTASRHPCVASSSATTVALPPFGRILQIILPTVCARHPAHFTGGLCIMHTDLYKQSLARARISLRPFTQPASCAPFCKHFPLPIFIRAAGKHLIRPAYHAQMSPRSRHVTTSTCVNDL